mmetsp:Transcript_22572/g.63381  ORF Transcript_22572/g.63381 Transcript_22572/m.63381 type:complete len:289 (-) Transcript_22572:1144-2010(-)
MSAFTPPLPVLSASRAMRPKRMPITTSAAHRIRRLVGFEMWRRNCHLTRVISRLKNDAGWPDVRSMMELAMTKAPMSPSSSSSFLNTSSKLAVRGRQNGSSASPPASLRPNDLGEPSSIPDCDSRDLGLFTSSMELTRRDRPALRDSQFLRLIFGDTFGDNLGDPPGEILPDIFGDVFPTRFRSRASPFAASASSSAGGKAKKGSSSCSSFACSSFARASLARSSHSSNFATCLRLNCDMVSTMKFPGFSRLSMCTLAMRSTTVALSSGLSSRARYPADRSSTRSNAR